LPEDLTKVRREKIEMRGLIKTTALTGVAGIAFATASAQAHITRIEITKTEPAFAGQRFGAIGVYDRLTGKAYGEVDPAAPENAMPNLFGRAAFGRSETFLVRGIDRPLRER
jgi:hypothetical protein